MVIKNSVNSIETCKFLGSRFDPLMTFTRLEEAKWQQIEAEKELVKACIDFENKKAFDRFPHLKNVFAKLEKEPSEEKYCIEQISRAQKVIDSRIKAFEEVETLLPSINKPGTQTLYQKFSKECNNLKDVEDTTLWYQGNNRLGEISSAIKQALADEQANIDFNAAKVTVDQLLTTEAANETKAQHEQELAAAMDTSLEISNRLGLIKALLASLNKAEADYKQDLVTKDKEAKDKKEALDKAAKEAADKAAKEAKEAKDRELKETADKEAEEAKMAKETKEAKEAKDKGNETEEQKGLPTNTTAEEKECISLKKQCLTWSGLVLTSEQKNRIEATDSMKLSERKAALSKILAELQPTSMWRYVLYGLGVVSVLAALAVGVYFIWKPKQAAATPDRTKHDDPLDDKVKGV